MSQTSSHYPPDLVFRRPAALGPDRLLEIEWLLTNGLGGFAMGTALGVPTRRYHALLIAATRPPLGRVLGLHSVVDRVTIGGETFDLSTFEFEPARPILHPHGHEHLREFFKTPDSASWVFELGGLAITRTLRLIKGEKACTLTYSIERARGGPAPRTPAPYAHLDIRPLVALRDFHELTRRAGQQDPFRIEQTPHSCQVTRAGGEGGGSEACALRLFSIKPQSSPSGPKAGAPQTGRFAFTHDPQWWGNFFYREDAARSQECTEDLFSPGVFQAECRPSAGTQVFELRAFVQAASGGPDDSSHDPFASPLAAPGAAAARLGLQLHAARSREEPPRSGGDPARTRLVAACDDFVVRRAPVRDKTPGTSLIAGYPWFSDWGRDTFISLPGALLCTGRFDEARSILATFAGARMNGLIPNLFVEETGAAEYNTVDASLWFIHAACEFAERAAADPAEARKGSVLDTDIGEACLDIIDAYRRGTDFHIAMDPRDHLITAGTEATQLTWMDARRDGVVFTPRHGKAVEINALWCTALARLAPLLPKKHQARAADLRDLAAASARSFRAQFWNAAGSRGEACLNDRLEQRDDGNWRPIDDIRPNQLFAVSLPHSPLSKPEQLAVLACIESRLLTPCAVRTLDPASPMYKPRYEGSLFARDGAYHQGTAWPWLLGVYAIAVLRAGGFTLEARTKARAALEPMLAELDPSGRGCLGHIAEVFDGEDSPDRPQRPGGCPAQAWSAAVALQALCMMDG